MLILRPRGRGNWRTSELVIQGQGRFTPLLFQVGQLLSLGGIVFRIVGIKL